MGHSRVVSPAWRCSCQVDLHFKNEGTQTIPYPFGFKGGYRPPGGNNGEGNVANGLYHFGQRYYDPTTGRWTQQDPVNQAASASQSNRFLFAGADPINEADPHGESAFGKLCPAAAIVCGLRGEGDETFRSSSARAADQLTSYAERVNEYVEPEEEDVVDVAEEIDEVPPVVP